MTDTSNALSQNDLAVTFMKVAWGNDPEMPDCIRPLSWLRTLLSECQSPEVQEVLQRDDPDAMMMMLREVQDLHDGLLALVNRIQPFSTQDR